ncbi:bacteriocin transporter [Erysipelothrix rhusiopathiae]|nr:bacteriocin transporter [Erysipelothrix rhusiopathiae]
MLGTDQRLRENLKPYYINITPSAVNRSINDLIEDVRTFEEKYEYDVAITTSEGDYTNQENGVYYFISGNESELLSHIIVKEGRLKESFFINDDWVISNNHLKKPSYLIDYLDNRFYDFDSTYKDSTSIYPLSKIEEYYPSSGIQTLVTIFVDEYSTQIQEMIVDYFQVYNYMNAPSEIFVAELGQMNDVNVDRELQPATVVAVISVLMLMVLTVLKNGKEIGIRYLQGQSTIQIIKKLFLKDIIVLSILFALTIFCTAFVISDSYGTLLFKFLVKLIPFVLIYVFSILGCLFITYFLVVKRTSNEILKSSMSIVPIYMLTLILKALSIIILLIPVFNRIQNIEYKQAHINSLTEHPMVLNSKRIAYASKSPVDKDYKDYEKDLFDLVTQNDIAYANHDAYDFYLNALKRNQNGNSEVSMAEFVPPSVHINNAYLDYVSITDETNRMLNPKMLSKDKNYILVSKERVNTYYNYLEPYMSNYEILYIQPNSTYVSANRTLAIPAGTINDPIYFVDNVYSRGIDNFTMSLLYNGETNSLTNVLERLDQDYDARYKVVDSRDVYELSIFEVKNDYLVCLQLIGLYFLILLIINYTSIKIYVDGYSKKIAIRYLNGTNYYNRYAVLINGSVFSTIAAFTYLLYQASGDKAIAAVLLGIFVVTLILEWITIKVSIRKYESMEVSTILKGDD